MKNLKTLSLLLAAGLAGVALVKLGSSSFAASFPSGKLAVVAISAALIGFAAYDYSRQAKKLALKSRALLRPTLPADNNTRPPAPRVRRVSAIVERTAA